MDKTAGAARDPAAGPRIHAEASPLVAALAERRGPSVVVPSPGEVVGGSRCSTLLSVGDAGIT
ncbi:hypothetical protein [Mesorhizobium sp.]|uniref:hypothetical protein n=1 Tax=Mesorhizobium sp. TaxID=1871066 RepID=UPI0011FE0296|nr:hypothetical protein [Mesorhizobium sp.]TIS63612.1 MAG: hypothetical protein E5W92_27020 [Mesorhizobium sp.]